MNVKYIFLLLALFFSKKNGLGQSVKSYPNIIFILADDLGYGDISSFNKESKIITPNIDKIAHAGTIFTDAHSASSVCTPTRYGILTGRYAWRTRLKDNVLVPYDPPLIEEGRTTMASMLKKQGYTTAAFGKWHLGFNWNTTNNEKPTDKKDHNNIDYAKPINGGPTDKGFDYFFGMDAPNYGPYCFIENKNILGTPNTFYPSQPFRDCRPGTGIEGWNAENILPELKKRTVDYVKKAETTRSPFFMYIALTGPHTPIAPSAEFKGRSQLNAYADFVLEIDDFVGSIIQQLKTSGLYENTMVIFTADNGCSPEANFKFLSSLGHYPSAHFRGHKADLFEGGHRIPLLVQWPSKIPAKKQVSNTVCLNDFMSTFAALTHYKLKDNEAEDSYNILPLLLNKSKKKSKEAIVHHSYLGEFAIRKGKWKLLTTPGSGGWSFPIKPEDVKYLPTVQLYDVENDPAETKNVEGQFPEVVKELSALLEKYRSTGRSR